MNHNRGPKPVMRAYEAAKALHEFGNEHSPSSYVLIVVTLRTHLSSFQRACEKKNTNCIYPFEFVS